MCYFEIGTMTSNTSINKDAYGVQMKKGDFEQAVLMPAQLDHATATRCIHPLVFSAQHHIPMSVATYANKTAKHQAAQVNDKHAD